MRSYAAAFSALYALSFPALADEARPAAKVSKLFPFFETYIELPEADRSHFDIEYTIKASDPALDAFAMWISPDGERIDIPLDENGHPDLSSIAPYVASDPMVFTSLPKGGGSVDVQPTPRISLSDRIAISDLLKAVEQTNSAIKKEAGMMSFAAPVVKRVVFDIEPGTVVKLRRPDGTEEMIETKETEVAIRPRKKDRDAVIVFSSPPTGDGFTD